jgi:hypothetical protein
MSSTYSTLKFELITTGEQSGAWGGTTNTNLGTAIEQAIVGMATLSSGDFTTNVATLTLTDTNTAQNARALCLNIAAGAVSAAGTINVPAIQKPYIIINGSSFTVTVKVSGLTGVAVPSGKRTVVYNNGTDVGNQVDYLATLALGTALPVTSGGTGTATPNLVAGTNTTVTGTWPNQTINATAAGSNTQVQYNSSGAFAGSSNLVFDGTNLTCGGNITAYSDETLKMNWRGFPEDFIEQLAQIQNGIYDRIDSGLTQVGVGAGSLQKVMPDAVQKHDNGLMSVSYGNAALVAVVELAKRVVSLEKQLKDK